MACKGKDSIVGDVLVLVADGGKMGWISQTFSKDAFSDAQRML